MGNIGNQSMGVDNTTQIISYEQYLQKRPKGTKSSTMSLIGDHANIKIVHNIYKTQRNSDKLHDYLNTLEQMRNLLDCDNLYLPIMYKIDQSQSYCHQEQQIEMFFECYEGVLKDEIQSRKRDKDFFSEEEAWYILYSLVRAVRKFQKFKINSGPLNSSMVLLNPKGHLKLKNMLSSPDIQKQHTYNYDAPEQLRNKRQNKSTYYNPNVSQTFSIGVTLLSVCSLIDGLSIYDFKKYTVNENMMNQLFNFVQKNLIRTMMSFSEMDRPLPSQIYEAFNPYEKKILALKPFKFVPSAGSKFK